MKGKRAWQLLEPTVSFSRLIAAHPLVPVRRLFPLQSCWRASSSVSTSVQPLTRQPVDDFGWCVAGFECFAKSPSPCTLLPEQDSEKPGDVTHATASAFANRLPKPVVWRPALHTRHKDMLALPERSGFWQHTHECRLRRDVRSSSAFSSGRESLA